VKDVSNGAATITGTADVADAPLTATAANIASTEGETFTGTLATFGDGDLLAKDTDYSATINWGDGTSLTAVTGSQMAIANGTCTVAASHVYTEAGSYTATVTVNDIGGDTATVADTAVVTPAATAATGATVNGTVNAALSTTVATFTHGNNSLPAVDFSATIDWGDGEITAGTVTPVSGTYSVSGTHTYADSGTFTVATTIVESGVSTVADGSALVASSLTPNEQYVTAVYEDVLTRVPEPGGLKYWPNILDQAQANGSLLARLSSVAMQIGQSAEYYGNFVVTTAYEKYLGRAPDQAGLNYWVQQMRHGLTDQELEAGFAASDEFYADAGGTNIAWIDAVYKLVLGRSPDSGGERYWNNQLNSLLSTESTESARLQAALGISGSTENNTQLINADYEHYLGRAADPGGLQYWLNQFADGASNEDVIAGFTGSPEYYKNRTGISLS
ncbi:MAG TPA: DUF4214 domain-containing protein, partial [Pirellulales bacterium]|nr:DUF4214 domain-containing protein [Pirellulales bacterium]